MPPDEEKEMTTTASVQNSVASAKAIAPKTRTVLFVTGAWMHTSSWDKFRSAFEAVGYTTLAPAWPYLDGNPADLRANPDKRLGSLTFGKIVDHYAKIIDGLDEQPLIIGHSMGGLVTQLLLDRGYGVAGIAIDPGPVAGALPGPVSLLAALPPIFAGPGNTHTITREGFAKNFVNILSPAEQNAAYDDYVVPTPTNIFYQAAAMIGTRTNVKARKQPLLVMAAEHDRTVTPYLSKAVFNVQKKAPVRTDFKYFEDRDHFLAGERGWEQVAQYALDWADEVLA
jgi:alpha-beta hydrolase superfamily lysophospholipase